MRKNQVVVFAHTCSSLVFSEQCHLVSAKLYSSVRFRSPPPIYSITYRQPPTSSKLSLWGLLSGVFEGLRFIETGRTPNTRRSVAVDDDHKLAARTATPASSPYRDSQTFRPRFDRRHVRKPIVGSLCWVRILSLAALPNKWIYRNAGMLKMMNPAKSRTFGGITDHLIGCRVILFSSKSR